MKKLNRTVILVALAVVAHVSFTQCMNRYENAVRKYGSYFVNSSLLFGGLTGSSAVSFIGKKIYNNWSNIYPENKMHYSKIARRCQIMSRFTAIPFISLSSAFSIAALDDYISSDSIIKEPLKTAMGISAVPGILMTAGPVYLYEKSKKKIKKMNA